MVTPRLLIVDDDSDICMCLVELLKGWMPSTFVEAITSGEAALQRLAANDYAVVLTDLALPGMSGVQLAQHIHATRPCLPIVLMSATAGFQNHIPAGTVVACVEKPFDHDRLVGILVQAIEDGRRLREDRHGQTKTGMSLF